MASVSSGSSSPRPGLNMGNLSPRFGPRSAKPLLDGFLEAIETNDREKFKRLCRSFKNLLHTRTCRGICNSDTKVHLNFGFWGERAIEWDFGNYWIDRNMKTEEDREFEKSRFIFKPALFLSKYPEWAALYRKEIEE